MLNQRRLSKEYPKCVGRNKDYSFVGDEGLFLNLLHVFGATERGEFERIPKLLQRMKGKETEKQGDDKLSSIYHLFGFQLNYQPMLTRILGVECSEHHHVVLWWCRSTLYLMEIKSVVFDPGQKKKRLKEGKEVIIQVEKINESYTPAYTYIRIQRGKGFIFEIMDSFEPLNADELRLRMNRRCKEKLLYDLPLHTKITEDEIEVLNSFALILRVPGVCTRYSLFDLENTPYYADLIELEEAAKEKKRKRKERWPLREQTYERRKELFYKYIIQVKKRMFLIRYACRRHTFDSFFLDDYCQEVLMEFFDRILSFNPDHPDANSWVYKVPVRHLFKVLKFDSRILYTDSQILVKLEEIGDIHSDYLEDIQYFVKEEEYTLEDQVYGEDIFYALRSLKRIYRETILLRMGNFKYREVCHILHEEGSLKSNSIETVKSRFLIGRKQMAELLSADGSLRVTENNIL